MLLFKDNSQEIELKVHTKELKQFELLSDTELLENIGETLVFDVECYPNYFLIAFKSLKLQKVVYFEESPDSTINIDKLSWILFNYRIIGFNSNNYDIPVVCAAVSGKKLNDLKEINDAIVINNIHISEIKKQWDIDLLPINHIDLFEVAPLQASLKMYAARLHCTHIQELPYDPAYPLTQEQAREVLHYCVNDLDSTELLYRELEQQIILRESLSQKYQTDLRSKSDAQIADAVISTEISKLKGYKLHKPKFDRNYHCKYTKPAYITFKTENLNRILRIIEDAVFELDANGSPQMPPELEKLKFEINQTIYKLGIGGLHSCENSVQHLSSSDYLLIDRDVASYYPRIILNQRLYPKHLGTEFLSVYESLVERRLAAKKAKNTIEADSIKITINGGFGKFGNKYSVLYSPDLLLQVTITGQLTLLMLIEAIELEDISVISANTDGIVIKCPRNRIEDLNTIIEVWEQKTGFQTEETCYKALYSRDVNNYIAIKEDGSCKAKGVYSEKGSALNSVLSKNPEALICSDAVKALLSQNIPLEQTIMNCKDIRRFVSVRNVKGGAVKDDYYLGKTVRWYYAKNETGTINYLLNGNKVPKSEGAKPLMDLPSKLPDDLDHEYYISEAIKILYDIGYYQQEQLNLFS